MAKKCDVLIQGGSGGPVLNAVPVYRDGIQKDWALDRLGNQLMLPNGIGAWYWTPESLAQDQIKLYVSFKQDGTYNYIRVFDLRGDNPILAGLPVQELWIEYSHLRRLIPPIVQPVVEYQDHMFQVLWMKFRLPHIKR